MVLANCTNFTAEPNASHAIAEGLGEHFRLPVAWIGVQLSCGVVLLQGEVTKEGREDTLQAEFLISIPQANLSVYDPTPIANNVENVDSAALAMAITTSIAGNQIFSETVEVISTSAEEVPEPVPEPTPQEPRVSCKTLYLKCWSWMLRREAACRDFNLYCKGNRAGKGYYSYSYTR